MAFLPFSVSSNTDFNPGFDDSYQSGVVSENPIGNGLAEDDGFEIFDPRGLFSPRRRMSAEDARFNHTHHQQAPSSLQREQPPLVTPSKPSPSLASTSGLEPASPDELVPSRLLQFDPDLPPKAPLSPRPWSLITHTTRDRLSPCAVIDDFIDVAQLHPREDPLQNNAFDFCSLDGCERDQPASPIESCPVSPCSVSCEFAAPPSLFFLLSITPLSLLMFRNVEP